MKTKNMKFDGKNIVVRELTVGNVKELFDMSEDTPMLDRFSLLLEKSCPEIKPDTLNNLTPSDVDPLVTAMLEVNESFFSQADKVGMKSVAEALQKIIGATSMSALLV